MAPKGERAVPRAGLRWTGQLPALACPPAAPGARARACVSTPSSHAPSEGHNRTSCHPWVTAWGARPSGATQTRDPLTVRVQEGPHCILLLGVHPLRARPQAPWRQHPLTHPAPTPHGRNAPHVNTQGSTWLLQAPPPSEEHAAPTESQM